MVRGLGANVKTRYAVQAVVYLARQEAAQVSPASEIAAAVGIAPKFLEDILGALRAAGIVQSRRGKEGGYRLIPPPAELSILRVAEALEGPVAAVPPESDTPIAAVTARAFDQALEAAASLLAGLTIEQLVLEACRLEGEQVPAYMYYL